MANELLKIAVAYRDISGGRLDNQIRVIDKVRPGVDGVRELENAIANSKNTHWSHPQVAVRNLDLDALGFKPTRLALPLPGERIGSTTWRSGNLHAHKAGPVYLVHRDAASPGGLGAVKHLINDVPRALSMIRKAPAPFIAK